MILSVTERSLVAEARRQATQLAIEQGLGATDAGRISIIVTELATNLLKHAGGGHFSLEPFNDIEGKGVEILAFDKGPGLADIQRSLTDGHSTAGSAGSGLGAVRRSADVFAITSSLTKGTAVLARVHADTRQVARNGYTLSSVWAPYPGESICGDGWASKVIGNKLVLLMADGSGHGQLAYQAARRAKEIFEERAGAPVEQIADGIHRALGATRGAAIGIAEIDPGYSEGPGSVNFVGIGNISAAVIETGAVRRMVSHNGTAGHVAPRIRMFQYPFKNVPTVILHSDGLTARWDLSEYPGLAGAHPSLIAGILFRDYRRGRDDASIVAARSNFACPPAS